MKVLKWLLVIILIIIGALLIIAAFLPKHINISSEIMIQKSAPQIFTTVASFNDRPAWDPWVSTDSTTKVEISNNEDFVGSSYAWDGEKVMTGEIVIDSVVYGEFISSSIKFGKGEDISTINWKFQENPDGTNVTWTFDSDVKYPIERLYMAVGKKMMQSNYDQGLKNLKEYVESHDILLSSLSKISEVKKPALFAMLAETSGKMEDVIPQFENLFYTAYAAIEEQGLQIAGPAFGYYFNYNQEDETVSVLCGFPVNKMGKSGNGAIAKSFPETNALMAVHTGPYDEFGLSYEKMMKYVEENKINISWDAFEVYLTDMENPPPVNQWKTEIYFPVVK